MINTNSFDDFRKILNFQTVANKPIDPRIIKTREQGSQSFKYISGEATNQILTEATLLIGYDFQVISKSIVRSEPKPRVEYNNGKRTYVKDQNGNQVTDPQAPFAEVTARLTIPMLGFREQCGSSVLTGGSSEQESCFKGATTDAFKKCCSLFGIGSELYTDRPTRKNILTEEQRAKVSAIKNEFGLNASQLSDLVATFLFNPSADQTYIMPCNVSYFCDWARAELSKKMTQLNN